MSVSQSDHRSEAAAVSTDVLPELIPDSLESIAAYKRYVDQTLRDYLIRTFGFAVADDGVLMYYYDAHEIVAMMHLNLDIPRGVMISPEIESRRPNIEQLAHQSPLLRVVERDNEDPELRFNRQIDAEFFIARRIHGRFPCLKRTLLREIFERSSNIETLVRVQVDAEKWNRLMSPDAVASVDSDSDA
jgi:hypothetical protein